MTRAKPLRPDIEILRLAAETADDVLASRAAKGRFFVTVKVTVGGTTATFDESMLRKHLDEGTTFEDFFAEARLNPNASLIRGTICGVRVEEIDDPLMQKIRYLDKLVDELAKGRPMEKVLRS